MDITPFDLAGSLAKRNALMQQQSAMDSQAASQNALAEAVPMLQADPQNAFATAAKKSPEAALKLLPYIKQMDDAKKAATAERADKLSKLAYTLKTQYGDPVIRKAVAQSKAAELAEYGFTPDQIQAFDYSDQNLQSIINDSQGIKDLIAQSNTDRTYEAGRSDHADTVANQKAQLAVTMRGQNMTDARARDTGGDDGGGLDDAAKVNAAVRYNQTGTMPPLGSGKGAAQDRREILNYAADIAKGVKPEDLVANIANYKANAASLSTQTRQFNAIETAANAAKNSANLALQQARKGGAGPTGVPVFDKWIQAGRKATGNMEVKNLSNHLDTFAEEYAKVMTGATGSGAATDSARAGAHERINSAYNLEQLESIISEMGKEMGGRHYAARAQIDSIKGQIGGKPYTEPKGVQTDGASPGQVEEWVRKDGKLQRAK